jgi:hypothetical protein
MKKLCTDSVVTLAFGSSDGASSTKIGSKLSGSLTRCRHRSSLNLKKPHSTGWFGYRSRSHTVKSDAFEEFAILSSKTRSLRVKPTREKTKNRSDRLVKNRPNSTDHPAEQKKKSEINKHRKSTL